MRQFQVPYQYSVYSIDDIEALGVDSGDELLDALTEQGQNQFAEASETGGINSSRVISVLTT